MKKYWIAAALCLMIVLCSGCGKKQNETKAASVITTEEEPTDLPQTVMLYGNIYIESKDGITTGTLPAGWAFVGKIINDEQLPLDGDLYGVGCKKDSEVYYNEQIPQEIYIASGEEQKLYKKLIVENLNWQYIAWEGNLFVRVSDLMESSKAEQFKDVPTAVIQLPVRAQCIGNVVGKSASIEYPVNNLEMNVPDYDHMNVCSDQDNPNYIYVETFFHSVKRYIVFIKTEKPSIPR